MDFPWLAHRGASSHEAPALLTLLQSDASSASALSRTLHVQEAGGQQCLELLRGAHLRPWSVTAESVFSRLRSLSINHTTGHDYCAALAPHLEAMAGLKSLDMSNTELCAAGAAALAPRLPGLRSLKRLNLSGNRLGSEGVRALAPVLARLPSLRQLDIRDNGVAMHALHEVEAMLSGDVVLLC